MPEGFCLEHGALDIQSKVHIDSETSGLPASNPQEHGHIIFHKAMLAKEKGLRQSITLHHCTPNNEMFTQLPSARSAGGKAKKQRGGPCTVCATISYEDYGDEAPFDSLSPDHPDLTAQLDQTGPQSLDQPSLAVLEDDWKKLYNKSACDIANGLQITGELFVAQRGKEYVVCVGQFLIRINLAMEAHTFWLKTVDYIRRPFAGIFQRHCSRGHLKRLDASPFKWHSDVQTGHLSVLTITIWRHIWSATHGPVSTQEPKAFMTGLQKWREVMRSSTLRTPIVVEVRNNQCVFNGYGAQESADMLFQALIHPAVIQYRQDQHTLINHPRLPLLSSAYPFIFRESAHRYHVPVTQQTLDILHQMQLVDPDAQIQPDGTAIVNPESLSMSIITPRPLPIPTRTRATTTEPKSYCTRQSRTSTIPATTTTNHPPPKADAKVYLPNYKLCIPRTETGDKTMNIYTPFTAQRDTDWWPILSATVVPQGDDVAQEVNQTTIGPYSFHIFVAAAWTLKHIGDSAPKGRRPLVKVDGSYTKCARIVDLKRAVGRPSKRRCIKQNENVDDGSNSE
ncbi:hypothetical protein FIBSPDRAFT_902401 [Athelia psychrophila]|uniref:Uncharacterized protein n=1 Tax=Athelia psychrophila TaxID=1759441 RepID=A0A167X9G1_9AGAM|nr:hypothetical protein FIBSPDRAFT_902401 [Fibularhizoctonia sp. CBS 109695]